MSLKHTYRFIAVLLSASIAGTAPAQIALPDMGASTGQILSPREAAELGNQAYHQIRASGEVIDDPLLNEYLRSVGLSLAAHDAEERQEYTFFMLAEESVNAFAMPGGFIGVHSGLLTTAQTEDEMAAVLAHEIAHITRQHLLRRIEDMRNMTLPTLLAMLGLILASGGGDGAAAAIVGGQAAMIQRMINFTRAHEAEADRIGIRTLAEAGYDPQAMAVFFERLATSNLAYGDGPSKFLRTHPITSSRVAEAKGYAAQLPGNNSARPEPYFLLMRARARVLGSERAAHALDYFNATLPRTDPPMEQFALRYGRALALIEMRQIDAAIEVLQALKKEDSGRLPYDLALADAWLTAGNTERALERYRGLYQLHGGRYAITMAYANALMRAGEASVAETLLRKELPSRSQDAWFLYQYADAANAAGKPVNARIAMAEAYYIEGRISDALQLLEQGKNFSHLDNFQRARLSARLEEMERTLTEEELEEIEESRPY